jgi:hypothetical protein
MATSLEPPAIALSSLAQPTPQCVGTATATEVPLAAVGDVVSSVSKDV